MDEPVGTVGGAVAAADAADPAEFFAGLEDKTSLRVALTEKLRELSDEDLEKVSTFIGWIQK